MSTPGINSIDELFIANNPAMPGLSAGKDDALTIDNTTTPATVSIHGGAVGRLANEGTGTGLIWDAVVSGVAYLRSLLADTTAGKGGIEIATVGQNVVIGNTLTGANPSATGGAVNVFNAKVGSNLNFRSLVAGANVTLTQGAPTANDITIAGAAGATSTTPEQFGAIGNGIADDSAALQSFLNAAQAGTASGVYMLEKKTYLINTRLEATSSLNLLGNGATLLNGTVNDYVLNVAGTTGANVLLTADAAAGATTIALASTAGILADSWLYVSSAQIWCLTTSVTYGEWAQVASVASPNVTLKQPLLYAYTTADSAKVNQQFLVDRVTIRDLNIVGTGTGNQKGIQLTTCINTTINGVSIRYCNERCIQLVKCLTFTITSCYFDRCLDAGLSYGVAIINGSSYGLVSNCTGNDVRHVVTIGGTAGVNRYITIANCCALNARDAGFDSHCSAEYIEFRGLQTACVSSLGACVTSQAKDAIISDIVVSGPAGYAVLAQQLGTPTGTLTISNVVGNSTINTVLVETLLGNYAGVTITNVQGDGSTYLVLLQCSGTTTITDFTIAHCKATRPLLGRGIRLLANVGCAISSGSIADCIIRMNDTTAGHEAIYLHGNSGTVTDVRVIANRTYNGNIAIRGVGTDFIMSARNRVTGYGSSAITIAGASNSLGLATDLTA